MSKQLQTHLLMLTAAVVIGGQICRPGEVVEVTDGEAKDLLFRGRAKPAEDVDGSIAAASARVANGEGDGDLNADLTDANDGAEQREAEAHGATLDAAQQDAGNQADAARDAASEAQKPAGKSGRAK
jgi:hypothetical protein